MRSGVSTGGFLQAIKEAVTIPSPSVRRKKMSLPAMASTPLGRKVSKSPSDGLLSVTNHKVRKSSSDTCLNEALPDTEHSRSMPVILISHSSKRGTACNLNN